ncbi:hypothetical protein CFOL_v3_02146 [Cephalotus follicularis]|uniref:Uncharacterized protein n=1 Tax=Cephalotus follicularis TaxID=3775 RepID=A0A1Q3ASR3_CEPFO|nr:hypothetical protein CFOL_v3_02146 [Cephalotus follicularis]
MLQWMGGSMRKVTTQYFEQRKRQQQQQAIRAESNADGVDLCGLHHKGHQSLDVINLLNFSTTAQEFKSTCPSGKLLRNYLFNFFSILFVTKLSSQKIQRTYRHLSAFFFKWLEIVT